jgi:hypothetical protein
MSLIRNRLNFLSVCTKECGPIMEINLVNNIQDHQVILLELFSQEVRDSLERSNKW